MQLIDILELKRLCCGEDFIDNIDSYSYLKVNEAFGLSISQGSAGAPRCAEIYRKSFVELAEVQVTAFIIEYIMMTWNEVKHQNHKEAKNKKLSCQVL